MLKRIFIRLGISSYLFKIKCYCKSIYKLIYKVFINATTKKPSQKNAIATVFWKKTVLLCRL